MAARRHDVFVSEFTAPDHWEVVWELERTLALNNTGTGKYKKRVDRLFKVVT